MNKLYQRIKYTKNKFIEISNLMEETYLALQEASSLQRQDNKSCLSFSSTSASDKEKIIKRIRSRMVYLNKTKQIDSNTRLEELAKLLDWMEVL